jgi:hypothetical protein
MDISWAFSNPKLSDIKVAITTEQPGSCRKRLAAANVPVAQPETSAEDAPEPVVAAADLGIDPSSIQATRPVCELVHAHKLVLLGNSEYFNALERWDNDSDDDNNVDQTDSRKHGLGDACQVAVVSLPDEGWFSTAKEMLRFMYTQQLDGNMGRLALMQLLQLGDQYGVAHLRRACLQQLSAALVEQWPAHEKKALFGVAGIISNDMSAGGELAAAATAMLNSIAAGFTTLEEAWRSEELREEFCSLPYAVVRNVLGCEALVVRSENTVLVAALSWLRTGGKDAPVEQRREVLLQVRLRQLSRCFLAWLFAYVHELQELVPAATRFAAVLHLGAPDADCAAKPCLGLTKRKGADPNLTVELQVAVEGAAVLEAVAACRAGGPQVDFTSAPVRYNGLVQTATISVWKDAVGGQVKLWAGAVPFVEVGAAGKGAEDGLGDLHYSYRITVGRTFPNVAVNEKHAREHHFSHFVAIHPTADPAHALQGCMNDQGQVVAMITLLG